MKKFAIPLLVILVLIIITVAGTQLAGFWSSPPQQISQPAGSETEVGQSETAAVEDTPEEQEPGEPTDPAKLPTRASLK